MATQMANLAAILQNMQMPAGVSPLVVSIPSPPKLEGALARNNFLTRVEKRASGKCNGPESMVVYKGHVYTGMKDGWVSQVTPEGNVRKLRQMSLSTCGQPRAPEGVCGRPMGMRVDKNGYLVVADAYHGIIKVNPQTGVPQVLVDARRLVANKPLGYINDLVIAKDNTIFFTSSSSKWPLSKEKNIVYEAERTGRVLFYKPTERDPAQQVQQLVTRVSFANGIELSEDENYLLIAEGSRSRILRAWIGASSSKRGTVETFAENLPGIVDNIRRSPRGTLWVGISQPRSSDMPNVLDEYGNNTRMRGAFINMVNSNMKIERPAFGIAVELSMEGRVLRSLQDPTGATFTSVSQVSEENGKLYIASPDNDFVGVIGLSSLVTPPPPKDQGGQGSTGGSTGTPPRSDDPRMVEFLARVRRNMDRMAADQLKQATVELVRELVLTKYQALNSKKVIENQQQVIRQLQDAIRRLASPDAGGYTTPSSGGSGPAPGTTPGSVNNPTQPSSGSPGSGVTGEANSATTPQAGGGQGGNVASTTATATTLAAATTTPATAAAASTTASAQSGSTPTASGSDTTASSGGSGSGGSGAVTTGAVTTAPASASADTTTAASAAGDTTSDQNAVAATTTASSAAAAATTAAGGAAGATTAGGGGAAATTASDGGAAATTAAAAAPTTVDTASAAATTTAAAAGADDADTTTDIDVSTTTALPE